MMDFSLACFVSIGSVLKVERHNPQLVLRPLSLPSRMTFRRIPSEHANGMEIFDDIQSQKTKISG
jgi:hypothetical protein